MCFWGERRLGVILRRTGSYGKVEEQHPKDTREDAKLRGGSLIEPCAIVPGAKKTRIDNHCQTAMTLMSPNKGETAVHGCHYPRNVAVRMREVLTSPGVAQYVCPLL